MRPMAGYQFPEHVRVTVGTMAENRKFIDALEKASRSDTKTRSSDACRANELAIVCFEKMVMAGVGLICGSLALDMRRQQKLVERDYRLRPQRRQSPRWLRRRASSTDIFCAKTRFPGGVDFLMMGTPVQTIVPLTKAFLPRLESRLHHQRRRQRQSARSFAAWSACCRRIFRFVAGHPIAGSEQWGAQAARPNLFVRHRAILTPTKKTDRKALEESRRIVAQGRRRGRDHVAGASRPGARSDQPFAPRSGLRFGKRARACAIAGVDLKKYCAGGFKDFTRIASSRPELWRDICLMNRRALGRSLADYIRYLNGSMRWIRDGKGALLGKRVRPRLRDSRKAFPTEIA